MEFRKHAGTQRPDGKTKKNPGMGQGFLSTSHSRHKQVCRCKIVAIKRV